MEYLLDINICIYIIKQKPISVLEKFQQYSPDQLGISSITLAELNPRSVSHSRGGGVTSLNSLD